MSWRHIYVVEAKGLTFGKRFRMWAFFGSRRKARTQLALFRECPGYSGDVFRLVKYARAKVIK